MRDRLGDLLLSAAQEEMDGVRLVRPPDEVVAMARPDARRRRRWPVAIAVAAAAVLLAGIGVIAADRDDQVRTVDPVDRGPSVTAVPDADAAGTVSAAARATMAAPWSATVQVGTASLDKLRYAPPDRYRLDTAEGGSSIWSGGDQWDGSGDVDDAEAWIRYGEGAQANPFRVLTDALTGAMLAAPVGYGPATYRVDVTDDVCRGGGGASAPGPAGCTVIVTIADGRLARVEAVANEPLGTQITVLDIGPADPGVRVDLPGEDPATTTSLP